MPATRQPPPPAARRNYATTALISQRAAQEAAKVRSAGTAAIARVVGIHQIAQARTSQLEVAQMLIEQEIDSVAEAMLNEIGFVTSPDSLDGMLAKIQTDGEFERLVESIVTDAARAAESVAVAVRPHIAYVRFLNLPSCSRCVVLAGRVYRWSTGFLRHPNCDCSMIPVTVASPLVQDPEALVREGQVGSYRTDPKTGRKTFQPGLSKADMQAIADGADLNRVVNVHRKAAGLLEGGHVLSRAGRPTPAGIYRIANGDREKAVALLKQYGYLL